MMASRMTPETIQDFDRKHLWHPYAALDSDDPVFAVESAEGCRLKLKDGRQLVDGMASWWSVIHGYSHPALNEAIKDQVDRISHVMFGGLTHEPAVRLGQTLVDITPQSLRSIFYVDSGSVAVEAALKMAVQYHRAKGHVKKTKFLTVLGGYHGDTCGAMSVSDPENGMHSMFQGILNRNIRAPRPKCRFHEDWDRLDFEVMENLVEAHEHEVAAVIIEPIAQGAGGMWFYHPEYLRCLRRICDRHGLLLIFDEVATGFGRTGKFFAMQHAGVVPDILCLGKALTGGMMSMAAVMTTGEVAQAIHESPAGVFMHGPTFMANPLACAVADVSINLLLQSNWQQRVRTIEKTMRIGLEPARQSPAVLDVRVLGAIGVIETHNPVDQAGLCRMFVERGVWIRPFNRFIYIMPPYIIEEEDLNRLCHAMVESVERC